ncbi:phage tail protein [Methylovorus sp. MM2]|nr:phage tail protein [Methylovorus sp. MM2]
MALFPANTPFFRLTIDDFMLQRLTKKEGMRAEVEEALNSIERSVMNEIETSTLRSSITEALKHLIVVGNSLLYVLPKGGVRVFRLDRYVVKRDPMGNVLEIIVQEDLSPMELEEEIRNFVLEQSTDSDKGESPDDSIELYTHVKRTKTGWSISQEINGKLVPGSEGTYPEDKSPWVPLRYISAANEDYGRSFGEEYLGDIKSLEALRKAIVQGAAAAAKVLFLVKPNGTTKAKVLAESESGDIKEGNKDDVSVLQMDKFADFRIAQETAKTISEDLSFAFQLNTAIQRNGERVTAEEIRFMAQELDASQGGIYSLLGQELQLPVVRRIMHQMERSNRLPTLPKGLVKPAITTGIEAIGRGNDQTKLASLLADLQPLGEAAFKYLIIPDYIKRQGAAKGIDMKGLIKTPEMIDQEGQQAQMAAMMQQGLNPMINQAGGMMKQQLAQEGNPNG